MLVRAGAFLYLPDMALPHVKLRILGYVFAQDLDWSVGVNFVPGAGPVTSTPEQDQTALDAWVTKIRALNANQVAPAALLGTLSTQGFISGLRAATVGVDGKERAVSEFTFGNAIAGTGNAVHPAQSAICLSTLTARPGASYRGRMYWPGILPSVNVDGRLDLQLCQNLATAAGQFLEQLGNAGDTFQNNLIPSIVSTTKGVATPITGVRVGNRFDTQRRRTDGERESYRSALVAQ